MFAHKYYLRRIIAFGILKIIGVIALISALMFATLFLHGLGAVNGTVNELEVTFLRLADNSECTILRFGNSAVLIDAGSASDAEHILTVMSEKGVTSLYAMILTNPDAGYMGGAARILRSFPATTVFLPLYQKENLVFDDLLISLGEYKVPTIVPQYNRYFSVGGGTITILPPLEKSYKRDGNYSLGVIAEFENIKLVFVGNADEKRTGEVLEYELPHTTLYKIPASGKSNTYSAELIARLNPQMAVTTSSLMDQNIIAALETIDCEIISIETEDVTFTFH